MARVEPVTAGGVAVSAPAVAGRDVGRRTLATACFLGGVLAPVVAVITSVHRHAVDVPYWDEWELVPLLEKVRAGTLEVSDLWSQHNEHRVLLPRVVLLALASLSRWNLRYELYLNIAVALVSLAGLLLLLTRSVDRRWVPWSGIAVSLMTFSMVQWESWTWGWQLSFFLNGLGVTMAAVALAYWPEGRWAIVLASAGGLIAALSLASGIVLLWLVPVAFALCADERRRTDVVVPSLMAAAISAIYFWDYHRPGKHPALGYDHPRDFAQYLLVYLGAPFATSGGRAAVFGALGIVLVALSARGVWRQGSLARRSAAPWLFLASYVLATGALTDLGRVGFGTSQALASRYTTFSSLFWISTFVIGSVALEPAFRASARRSRKFATGATLAVLLFVIGRGYADTYAAGHRLFRERLAGLRRARPCLMTYRTAPRSCFDVVYHHPDRLRERLEILERLRLGPFRAP